MASIGYVYMIDCERFTKIGVSARPQDRLREIAAANPHDVYLVHIMPTKHMIRSEKYLHHLLVSYRVKCEWFRLPEEIYFWLKSVCDIDSIVKADARQRAADAVLLVE